MGLSQAALAAATACLLPCAARAGAPAPAETPVRVATAGRSSVPVELKLLCTEQAVPATFSGQRVNNTPSFRWHVSRHFALKTDYDDEKARFYLTLLELAWPHYVAAFGREPAGMDSRRLAVVYGSSKAALQKALLSDGIVWDFRGGGITFESGYRCAYVYPSGSLAYHHRYILLHECTRLFQMCLAGTLYNTPEWFYEGLADALGHHVYEAARRRLTVRVLDKATTANYLDEGLAELRRRPLTARQLAEQGKGTRGGNFLLVHFFLADAERRRKFNAWRDEAMALPKGRAARAVALLPRHLGPWEGLDEQFARWLATLSNTFHYAVWGWEQDGETLWSYGFAEGGKLSRTDVLLQPGRKPDAAPWRMDYPLGPVPALVGPVARGTDAPTVGAVIDFSRNAGRGVAGIGLGLVEDENSAEGATFLRVLIDRQRTLVVDGAELGMGRKTFELPGAFREAMAAGGQRLGATVRIAARELEIVLRAGAAGGAAASVFRASVPVSIEQRRRLLERPLTIVARGGWHGVTPYFDVRTRPDAAPR